MPAWTFVRHGQSCANAEGWLAGNYDSGLTELGRRQARDASRTVGELSFVRVFTSDSSRARDTASLLLAGRRVSQVSTASLRERHLGVFERRNIDEVAATGLMQTLTTWDTRPAGGECLRDVAVRVIGWLSREDIDHDTLVVAHGVVLRAVIGTLDRMPRTEIGSWRPRNCETITRQIPVGTWRRLADELTSSA